MTGQGDGPDRADRRGWGRVRELLAEAVRVPAGRYVVVTGA